MAHCRAMGARPDQEELLLPLVQAVSEQLARRLRPGIAPEDCGPAFPWRRRWRRWASWPG